MKLGPGPNFMALPTAEFYAYDHGPSFHDAAYRFILRLRSPFSVYCASAEFLRRMPFDAEYARAQAEIPSQSVKYALRKHGIPCSRKRRFFAYGKRAMRLGPDCLLLFLCRRGLMIPLADG